MYNCMYIIFARVLMIFVFSDECGQSGVDSDEDVITNYLPGEDCLSVGGRHGLLHHNTVGIPIQHHPHIDTMSTQQRAAAVAAAQATSSPLVPTISVTPHSPAAKHYPVLGKYYYMFTNP